MARPAPRPRPPGSAALAGVLACAHLMTAVGLPAVARAGQKLAGCGCASSVPCETGRCGCSPVASPPAGDCRGCGGGSVSCAPEPAAPSCCAKPAGEKLIVRWLPVVQVGGCRKASPLGSPAAAEPICPPPPAVAAFAPLLTDRLVSVPVRPSLVPAVPPDPPPRTA